MGLRKPALVRDSTLPSEAIRCLSDKKHACLSGVVFGALCLLSCGGSSAKNSQPIAVAEMDAGADANADAIQIQAIAAAINEFSPAAHTCWARGAADDFALDGRVLIGIDIGAQGEGKAEILEESVGDAVLTDCLLALWQSYRWPDVFAAGDRIVLPPFEFVAPSAQYSVALAHTPVQALSQGKLMAQVLIDKTNSGNGQASMSMLIAKQGVRIGLHTHESAEVLFVLSGKGRVLGIGAPREVSPGMAIYVPPGVVHGFEQVGDETTEMVQLYAPGGPEGRFRDPTNLAGTKAVSGKAPRRGPKPLLRAVGDVPSYRIAEGKAEVRILMDETTSGDEGASLSALTAQVGAAIPLHRHENSSEYLFVLEGMAEMTVAGRRLLIQAGDAVQVPSNVEHGATIIGTEPFKALQFYASAGPEQRFKKASHAAN